MKPILLCALFATLPFVRLPAGEPEPGAVGRYQLVVAPAASKDGKPVLYRIDTQTGKTWVFDAGVKAPLMPADAERLIAPEKLTGFREQLLALFEKGTPLVKTPSWTELDETSRGFMPWSGEPVQPVPREVLMTR